MLPVQIILIHLRAQLAQQVALALGACSRLLKRCGQIAVLTVLREVRQVDTDLHANEIGVVLPVGDIAFHREIRLVGLLRQRDVGGGRLDLLVESANDRVMINGGQKQGQFIGMRRQREGIGQRSIRVVADPARQSRPHPQRAVPPVMCLVVREPGLDLGGQKVGLGGLGIAIGRLERLELQPGLRRHLLREHEPLFSLVDIDPRQRGVTGDHAPVVVERGPFGAGFELLALSLESAFVRPREILAQAEGEFSEIVAPGAERLVGVDRQFLEPGGEFRVRQLLSGDRLLLFCRNRRLAPCQQRLIGQRKTDGFVEGQRYHPNVGGGRFVGVGHRISQRAQQHRQRQWDASREHDTPPQCSAHANSEPAPAVGL